MNTANKQQIVANIKAYQSRKGLSQNKTADKLGVSPATLSAIYDTDKWGQLSDQMWNEVDTRLASITNAQANWQIRETDNFSTIKAIVKTAEQTGGLILRNRRNGLRQNRNPKSPCPRAKPPLRALRVPNAATPTVSSHLSRA
jgi:predicted transcriptional regulator